MSDDRRVEEEDMDLSFTKYRLAADIINKALQLVLSKCKPNAKIVNLCEKGDSYVTEQTGNMYKNAEKKIESGVAFPTCISINNTVCHFSPLASDKTVLEEGDIIKINMGCHIDGFIAVVAHTHVLQDGRPVSGRKADVLAAANTAAEVALRLVRPGKTHKDVSEAIHKVAAAYDCKIVEGVLSHQLKRFVWSADAEFKSFVWSASNPDTRVDDAEFKENEGYSIDIVTSTGNGKPNLLEKQTTIYKRAVGNSFQPKCESSMLLFNEISQNFPIMPFSARALEEKLARLRHDIYACHEWLERYPINRTFSFNHCFVNGLLQPFPVLRENPGDYVAHIKFTVLLMPHGPERITSHRLQELQPTKTINDPDIRAWLDLPTKTKKKGGGEKKKVASDKNESVPDGSSREQLGGRSVCVYPRYVTYLKKTYEKHVLIFSEEGIKLKRSASEGEDVLKWNLCDIERIRSKWCILKKVAAVNVVVQSKGAGEDSAGFDENWLDNQNQIISLDGRYKKVWKIRGNFEEFHQQVVYPKGDPEAVPICEKDLDSLQPGTYVNSTIIDFYMKYLENQIPADKREKFLFFNSFFFKRLIINDESISSFDAKKTCERVHEWRTRPKLFENEYILIPVNYMNHWSLVVICRPNQIAKSQDEPEKSLERPCILHMNSYKNCHTSLNNIFPSYLFEEWKKKNGDKAEISQKFDLPFVSPELPQQPNLFDCGLFLLHYAELFLQRACMGTELSEIRREYLKSDWFQRREPGQKRVRIKELIRKILDGEDIV